MGRPADYLDNPDWGDGLGDGHHPHLCSQRCPACRPLPVTEPGATRDPVAALNALGAVWFPDFDAYASGQLDASQVRCVLCGHAPCDCPPFGTPEYFALTDRLHGRTRGGGA
jgi:hypothetical protein